MADVEESNEPAGYAEAVAELDELLRQLEGPDVDVDLLTRQVARAAELIAFCRTRIEGARFEVERIVASMADEPAATTENSPGDGALDLSGS